MQKTKQKISIGAALATAGLVALLCISFLGFFAARISFVLPLALSFAGGTMLFIIVDQMLPCSNEGGDPADTAYALLAGVCVMLVGEVLLR